MELYQGRVLWPDMAADARPLPRICRPLDKHESCDVLVIGTGLTGALAAYTLAEAGLDVVAVDRRPLCGGGTRASTALLQVDLDHRLVELAELYNPSIAADVYRHTRTSIQGLVRLIERLGIDCDLAPRPGLLLAAHDGDVRLLQAEAKARNAADIDCQYLDGQALLGRFGIARPAALLTGPAVELDPLKLSRALWAHAMLAGVRVYPETGVVNQRWVGVQPIVHTSTGHPIDTTHLVFATGYEAPEMFAELRPRVSLMTTFVAVTPPLGREPWPERAIFSDTGDPYCYARTTPDGRVLIGGGDTEGVDGQRQQRLLPGKTADLLATLAATVPGLPPLMADHAWSAAFAVTDDGLPFIGSTRGCERCHLALGYGGNGMALGLLAAEIVRDTVLARGNPAASLFSLDRPIPRGRLAG